MARVTPPSNLSRVGSLPALREILRNRDTSPTPSLLHAVTRRHLDRLVEANAAVEHGWKAALAIMCHPSCARIAESDAMLAQHLLNRVRLPRSLWFVAVRLFAAHRDVMPETLHPAGFAALMKCMARGPVLWRDMLEVYERRIFSSCSATPDRGPSATASHEERCLRVSRDLLLEAALRDDKVGVGLAIFQHALWSNDVPRGDTVRLLVARLAARGRWSDVVSVLGKVTEACDRHRVQPPQQEQQQKQRRGNSDGHGAEDAVSDALAFGMLELLRLGRRDAATAALRHCWDERHPWFALTKLGVDAVLRCLDCATPRAAVSMLYQIPPQHFNGPLFARRAILELGRQHALSWQVALAICLEATARSSANVRGEVYGRLASSSRVPWVIALLLLGHIQRDVVPSSSSIDKEQQQQQQRSASAAGDAVPLDVALPVLRSLSKQHQWAQASALAASLLRNAGDSAPLRDELAEVPVAVVTSGVAWSMALTHVLAFGPRLRDRGAKTRLFAKAVEVCVRDGADWGARTLAASMVRQRLTLSAAAAVAVPPHLTPEIRKHSLVNGAVAHHLVRTQHWDVALRLAIGAIARPQAPFGVDTSGGFGVVTALSTTLLAAGRWAEASKLFVRSFGSFVDEPGRLRNCPNDKPDVAMSTVLLDALEAHLVAGHEQRALQVMERVLCGAHGNCGTVTLHPLLAAPQVAMRFRSEPRAVELIVANLLRSGGAGFHPPTAANVIRMCVRPAAVRKVCWEHALHAVMTHTACYRDLAGFSPFILRDLLAVLGETGRIEAALECVALFRKHRLLHERHVEDFVQHFGQCRQWLGHHTQLIEHAFGPDIAARVIMLLMCWVPPSKDGVEGSVSWALQQLDGASDRPWTNFRDAPDGLPKYRF